MSRKPLSPLLKIRRNVGLTQFAMNTALGYPEPTDSAPPYYSKVERGLVKLSLERAYTLTKLANVTLGQILGHEPIEDIAD